MPTPNLDAKPFTNATAWAIYANALLLLVKVSLLSLVVAACFAVPTAIAEPSAAFPVAMLVGGLTALLTIGAEAGSISSRLKRQAR